MISLLFIIICAVAVVVDIPYKEVTAGKHWDCDKAKHGEIDLAVLSTEKLEDLIDYCGDDRMKQVNPCGAPSQMLDWKTGTCVNK